MMVLKLPSRFPIFAPPYSPNQKPSPTDPKTEVRFSRWNNANAEKFNSRRRAQKEIEDEIRRERRFESAIKIAELDSSETPSTSAETFRSIGTPSSPSSPSIPGRKSKYSKTAFRNLDSHPAFRVSSPNVTNFYNRQVGVPANVMVGEDGVSYVIDGAPFEFKYSYTETPKVKPLKLREEPYVPFGPTTMPKPWTGRAPLPPSKKKLREFDSFQLPPPHKKGVKPVQAPGPFLAGSGPKYVQSREEILGEPLTQEEIDELVKSCMKSNRQLNMGRDGLTHNMLDNIHAHWKRRRVCKIKCKGVCTVDMDNVCKQLEERTGGKIIYRTGGVLYLFRGRNYNYRTRPRFPLMLWRPVSPVYPRLILRVPEGLTHEEATAMRQKGRQLIPICKLAKNGLYCDLVKNVREAFEECELVRINCQGLNGSDYRKIGAKLKDLVPCVLLSFENEHILMWRGQNWKSSFQNSQYIREAHSANADRQTSAISCAEGEEVSGVFATANSVKDASVEMPHASNSFADSRDRDDPTDNGQSSVSVDTCAASIATVMHESDTVSERTESPSGPESTGGTFGSAMISNDCGDSEHGSEGTSEKNKNEDMLNHKGCGSEIQEMISGSNTTPGTRDNSSCALEPSMGNLDTHTEFLNVSGLAEDVSEPRRINGLCTGQVLSLLKRAVDKGSALVLDDGFLDADNIFQITVAFAKNAPPDPVFRHKLRKAAVQRSEKPQVGDLEDMEITTLSPKRGKEKMSNGQKVKAFDDRYLSSVPQGSLGVDELAKLLA